MTNAKWTSTPRAVRDVERRVQMAEAQRDVELPAFDQPLGCSARL